MHDSNLINQRHHIVNVIFHLQLWNHLLLPFWLNKITSFLPLVCKTKCPNTLLTTSSIHAIPIPTHTHIYNWHAYNKRRLKDLPRYHHFININILYACVCVISFHTCMHDHLCHNANTFLTYMLVKNSPYKVPYCPLPTL